ncbi:tetratricopeptide repeat protein [Streptomyces sp. NPDC015220]|uniref:tetratricopeptide repeat protein n=1 Tax=Streptomyces sp. NPDC015220 TaxID=3364947 RepID=UPI00370103CC
MTTDDVPDYYAEFEIDRAASADQVSRQLDRAFRTWSSRASRAPDAKRRREAEDKVELVSKARKELLDSARRQAYDRRLHQARRRARVPESAPQPQPPTQPQPQPQPTLHGRDWVGHARRLISEGDDEGALYELRQAVHHDEGNGDAWRLLGTLHARQGQLGDALQEFQRARALHPYDALTHSLIAQTWEQLGDHHNAVDWHLKAVELAPADVDLRIATADSLYRVGRHYEALSNYERALTERPGHDGVRNQIGWIWLRRAEDAMVWHPTRQRYVIASADSASMVTHCVDQGLAVGVSDGALRDRLTVYRVHASEALSRTWRWYKSMAPVMGVCAALVLVLQGPLSVLPLAGFFGLPIAMGVKPRWQHTCNELPPHQRPPTRRVS